MRDTLIVFVGMGVLLLFPIFFYAIKSITGKKTEQTPRKKYLNLGVYGIVALLVVLILFKVYTFTLESQPPLVAERYITSSEGGKQLQGMGIDSDKSLIALSENVYENEDGTTSMYIKFETQGEEIFTKIYMKRDEDSWEVTIFERIENNSDKDPEIKKRFFPIKGERI